MLPNTAKILINSILIFFLSIILINTNLVGNFYWQVSSLFTDHNLLIDWLECNSMGVNLFSSTEVICNTRKIPTFNYGHAILIFPWSETINVFYRDYLPHIVIFLFIILTVKIIDPQKKIEILLLFLCLINPSTLLAYDRLNMDLFVYILAITVCFNRIYFINWILTLFLSFIKIYPAALFINIFFENKKRTLTKIFLIIILLIFFTIIYFFYFTDYILYFLNNVSSGKAGYHYLFSLNSLPKIFKYIFNFNYQLLLLVFYSLFILAVIAIYKKSNSSLKDIGDDIYSYNSKLFMIGGYITLISYVIFSNWFYREIFLILMIPYIVRAKINSRYNISSLLIYFFIARYFFIFIYSYVNIHDGITYVDSIRIFSLKFLLTITIKSIFDFIIMSMLTSILFLKTKNYIQKFIFN